MGFGSVFQDLQQTDRKSVKPHSVKTNFRIRSTTTSLMLCFVFHITRLLLDFVWWNICTFLAISFGHFLEVQDGKTNFRRNSESEQVNGGQDTYVLDNERVACDPLHGFEQEAGQRHPLTPWVHGQPLQREQSVLTHSKGKHFCPQCPLPWGSLWFQGCRQSSAGSRWLRSVGTNRICTESKEFLHEETL